MYAAEGGKRKKVNDARRAQEIGFNGSPKKIPLNKYSDTENNIQPLLVQKHMAESRAKNRKLFR